MKTSYDVITHYITDDFDGNFEVNSTHLIRLCDAFTNDKLNAKHLEIIGFALEASEHFMWEDSDVEDKDSPVAETIHAWASPEINYPLNDKNIAKFRELLLTSNDTFTREDVTKQTKKIKS